MAIGVKKGRTFNFWQDRATLNIADYHDIELTSHPQADRTTRLWRGRYRHHASIGKIA
jgi:hypothetical protein